MPNCRTCSPWCQRCHKKAEFKFPVECPDCGWYNPFEREVCAKCGRVLEHDDTKAVTHLNAEVKKACFFCTPFEKPLCGDCLKEGRTKICPECGTYAISSRKVCKRCGHEFEDQSSAPPQARPAP